jgi:hypothetical protein
MPQTCQPWLVESSEPSNAACFLCRPQVPFFFKHAVDALAIDPTGAAPSALWGVATLGPVALLMGYGISRGGAAFCGEMRNIVFAKVRVGFLNARDGKLLTSPASVCQLGL